MNLILMNAFALCLFAFQSCQSVAQGTAEKVKLEGQEFEGTSFGKGITSSTLQAYDTVLESLKSSNEVETTVKAKVNEVCQAKGCWMILADGNSTEMMVKFEDYGFFMPKDISGKEVIIQGKAFKEVTPVDELRHYAEDAGKSKEEIAAITEAKEELKFMATGVLLLNQ